MMKPLSFLSFTAARVWVVCDLFDCGCVMRTVVAHRYVRDASCSGRLVFSVHERCDLRDRTRFFSCCCCPQLHSGFF